MHLMDLSQELQQLIVFVNMLNVSNERKALLCDGITRLYPASVIMNLDLSDTKKATPNRGVTRIEKY